MDIFISYSAKDKPIAEFLHQHLTNEGMSVFLASASLQPGQLWPEEVLNALRTSSWVLFLASRAACSSAWVQQELGAALITKKTLVPIVWDMPLLEVPGWTAHYQALDFSRASLDEIKGQMTAIAQRIRANKAQALLIAGLILASLFAFGSD